LVTDAQVDAAAKAFYDFQLTAARNHIDGLRLPDWNVDEFVQRLRDESPTAQILIFYSYLDELIQDVLRLNMFNLDSQTKIERVFGTNGPLATFSGRILIAYHLGWLDETQKNKLEAFRKLRNIFAHRASKIRIDDPEAAPLMSVIDYAPSGMFERIAQAVPTITFTANLLCNLVALALSTFEQLIAFPIARTYHIDPADLLEHATQPVLVKRVRHILVKCLLIAGQTN
jgi:DNA-binding MltR family transcriptional regulator